MKNAHFGKETSQKPKTILEVPPIGTKFGILEVISGICVKNRKTHIKVKCTECFKEKDVRLGDLLRNLLSCTHKNKTLPDLVRPACQIKHPLRKIWSDMLNRCYNENNRDYKNYGGRGIMVCDEWLNFENFFKWAEPLWRKGLTLDREQNHLQYCPENCRFVDFFVQANNRRNNVKITAWGQTKSIAEWLRDDRVMASRRYISKQMKLNRIDFENVLVGK